MEWGQFLWEISARTRGLKLRVPGQFKVKQNPWFVVFVVVFWRQRLRTRIAIPTHANLSLTLKNLVSPLPVLGLHKETTPPFCFPVSLNLKHQRWCCCTSEPKPNMCCVPPSNFSKRCCPWHKQVLAEEQEEEEWRIRHETTKHFFKASLLLCNNLLLLFFFLLQINSGERLKTPQLTMRGGREIPAAG